MKIEAENVVGSIAEHVAAIITKIDAGASVRSCTDQPGGLTRNQFRRAVARDPVLLRRYNAAIAKWTAPHARSLMHFDEIERRIVAGGAILDILASGETFPDFTALRKFLKAYPEYDARYRAAHRTREAGPNARGIVARYSDRELRRAVSDLLLSDERYISVRHVSENGPHMRTLMDARARSPELLVAVESAIAARRSRLHIVYGQPKIDPANARLIAPPKIIRPDPSARLASALSQNDVWRLAAAALPKHLDRNARDDIIGDIAMAVLSGDLAPHLIESAAKRFVRDHVKRFSAYEFASLDKSLSVDSTFSLMDTLTTDRWE